MNSALARQISIARRILPWTVLFAIMISSSGFAATPGTAEEFLLPEANTIAALGPLATGSNGDLWFGMQKSPNLEKVYSEDESWLGRISPSGLMTIQIAASGTPTVPESLEHIPLLQSITEAPNESVWFTAHGGWDRDESFVRSITQAGEPIYQHAFTTTPSGAGDHPGPITHDKRGHIWLAEETGDLDYHLFSPLVSSIIEINQNDLADELVSYPIDSTGVITSITEGPDENIWFTGGGGDGWSISGQELDFIGKISQSGEVVTYALPDDSYPNNITQGPDHNMWFTETQSLANGTPIQSYIERLTTDTKILTSFPATSIGPLVPGPDGNLWFINRAEELTRITPSGEMKSFTVPNIFGGDLSAGSDGSLWFISTNHAELGRFVIPFAPANTNPPSISGTPVEHQVLYASPGSWTHEPANYSYQWQVCDPPGNSCTNLSSETGATHAVTTAEIGHTLKVVVTASNIAGARTVDSTASPQIAAAPPIEPKIVTRRTMAVRSTARWKFEWHKHYTTIGLLLVSNLPPDGSMELRCSGRGCIFHRRVWKTMASHEPCHRSMCQPPKSSTIYEGQNVAALFRKRHLAQGVRIAITITKSGWIGKTFVFKTRPGKEPRLSITCIAPNSKISQRCE